MNLPEPQTDHRIVPIDRETAAEVRSSMQSPDYAHPVHTELAANPAPCRVCLHKFVPGEDRRLLFTYDPFRHTEPNRPLPGPVFIHRAECRPFEGSAIPDSFAADRLTLSGFGDDRALLAETRTASADDAHRTLSALFADEAVHYVHVRSTPNGCFLCAVERG
jgi:hypothetical protein